MDLGSIKLLEEKSRRILHDLVLDEVLDSLHKTDKVRTDLDILTHCLRRRVSIELLHVAQEDSTLGIFHLALHTHETECLTRGAVERQVELGTRLGNVVDVPSQDSSRLGLGADARWLHYKVLGMRSEVPIQITKEHSCCHFQVPERDLYTQNVIVCVNQAMEKRTMIEIQERPQKKLTTTRSRHIGRLAHSIPPSIMLEHGGLDPLDYLVYLVAFNAQNDFIVPEAFAGTGKTTMLVQFVERLPRAHQAVLLLSFTRSAIHVAESRMSSAGVGIQAQTFDSLFYHISRRCQGAANDLEYEDYRELASHVSCHVLSKYQHREVSMEDIQYVLVDEAQDSPPGAYEFLRLLRSLGKTVIIVGDRRQAIFEFQGTTSLFDMIPSHEMTTFTLRHTRRCCAKVVEYINERFDMTMKSAVCPTVPSTVHNIVYQANFNSRLGQVYAQLLFSMDLHITYDVADGDSKEKFEKAVEEWIMDTYRVSPLSAQEALQDRRYIIGSLPPTVRLHFATVHRFKGNEGDVTILDPDIELAVPSTSTQDENMKYVACTRPRWGILDLGTGTYHGCPAASERLREILIDSKTVSRTRTSRMAAASTLSMCIACLSPGIPLAPPQHMIEKTTTTYPHFASSLLLSWDIERRSPVPVHAPSYLSGLHASTDQLYHRKRINGTVSWETDDQLRKKITRMKWVGLISRYAYTKRSWNISVNTAYGACVSGCLLLFHRTRRLDALTSPTLDDIQSLFELDFTQLPGILGKPQEWKDVVLRNAIRSTTQLRLRTVVDICIVDHQTNIHTITPRFGHSLTLVHHTHAYLSTVTHTVNGGFSAHNVTIYHANQLIPVPVLLPVQDETLEALNQAMDVGVCPVYYNQGELSTETINEILKIESTG